VILIGGGGDVDSFGAASFQGIGNAD